MSKISVKQAVNDFLLSCKVEGKSYGTIECYSDKLKGFLWYCDNYDLPNDIKAIETNHLRQFLAYLRETPHRFNSNCPRAKKPINSTIIQKYYRALSALINWSISEGILDTNPLVKIRVPKAEKKVIKALSSTEVNQIVNRLPDTFEGIRNKAIILVLVDCGLRLGELLNIKVIDVNMQQQLLKVDGKTGERVVRFGATTAKALKKYLKNRANINGHCDSLWIISEGTALKDSSIETLFISLSKKVGIHINPHLLNYITCPFRGTK
jgi:integrase/recombinase XerC